MDVPSELARLDQWVCWRQTKGGKRPFKPRDGRPASHSDRSHWSSYEDACRAQSRYHMDGIGFVFSADDPYCGLDLDHCILEDGTIHPKAQEMLDYLNSYTEVSPSGTGVHCIVKGHIGGGRRTDVTDWGGMFEAYDQDRFFTFTGRSLNGSEIRESAIHIQVEETTRKLDDNWIVDARKNTLFVDLYDDGDTSNYESASNADMALMDLLIHYIGEDRPRSIFMAFCNSALYRGDAKSGGDDYVLRTLESAMSRQASTGEVTDARFEREVRKQMFFQEAREEARLRLNAKVYEQRAFPYPAPGWSLADELALPPRDVVWRVQDLQQVHQNIVLIAGYKLGKTTLALNLVRSLVDGTPFMGMYEVTPVEGNIGVVNYELDREYFYDFCREMKIQHPEKIKPVHARGHGTIPFWLPAAQDSLVEYLEREECRYLVLDPTAQAWDTLLESEGDNIRAAQFTRAIDTVKQRAGIEEAFLTHHTSRATQDQGRGPSALEGWYDAGWFLQGERDALQFKAMGRGGIDVPLMPVAYHEDKAHTFLPDDRDKKAEVQERKDAKRAALEVLKEQGPKSQSALEKELRARGVGVSANRIKKLLADWCGSMDNNMAVRTETHGKVAQRTYYLRGEEGHE